MYLEQIQALGLRIDILSLLSMAIMDVSLKYYSKWDITSEKAKQKVNGSWLPFVLASDGPYSPKDFSVGL